MTWIVVTYFTAFCVGILAAGAVPVSDGYLAGGVATVAATLVVFAFSTAFRNASFYDAYWSVGPILLVGYWSVMAGADANPIRQAGCLGAIAFWGTRLTTNWATGWKGLGDEDWRYVRIAQQTGWFYPLVNLAGIHMMPTLLVFLALRPAYVAVTTDSPLQLLDLVAVLVCVGATVLEATADGQLRTFARSNQDPEASIDEGLWRWSRHPNYLGEILFWWGVWLFGVAATESAWWTVGGAVAMAALFRFISIPLMERRQLVRRPSYAAYQRTVPMLLPWPPGKRRLPKAQATEEPSDFRTTPGDPIMSREVRLAIDTMPVVPPPVEEDD